MLPVAAYPGRMDDHATSVRGPVRISPPRLTQIISTRLFPFHMGRESGAYRKLEGVRRLGYRYRKPGSEGCVTEIDIDEEVLASPWG